MTATDALRELLRRISQLRANPVAIGNHADVEVMYDDFERLARDGLAGEADNLYVTCRDCHGPLRKDAVTHLCKAR